MYKTITMICICGILALGAGAMGAIQVYEDFATDPGWLEQDNRINGLDFGFSNTNNTGQGAGEAGGVFSNTGNGYYGADITSAGVGLFAATDTLHAEGHGVTIVGGSVSPHMGWWDRDQVMLGTPGHWLGLDIQYIGDGHYNGYLGFTTDMGNSTWVIFEDAFTLGVPFTWSIDWDPSTGLLSGTIDSNSGSQTITDPRALNAEFDIFGMYNGYFSHSDDTSTVYMDSVEYTAALVLLDIPGDANGDRIVNDADASIVASNWQKTGLDPEEAWGMGDFNGDFAVNDADATIMAANWSATSSSAASVPEPSTLFLLVAAMVTAWIAVVQRRARAL